jgi:hypothetical protein
VVDFPFETGKMRLEAPHTFSIQWTVELAQLFGFNHLIYTGEEIEAEEVSVFATSGDTSAYSSSSMVLQWEADTSAQMFNVQLRPFASIFYVQDATVNAVTGPRTYVDSAMTQRVAHGFRPYDLVSVEVGGQWYTRVYETPPTPQADLLGTSAGGFENLFASTAALTPATRVMLESRRAFVLSGGGYRQQTPEADSLAFLRSPEEYAPVWSSLGLVRGHIDATEGTLRLPRAYRLTPTPYILMVWRRPEGVSSRYTHESESGPQQILAKLLVTRGYARIMDEMSEIEFTTPTRVSEFEVEFLGDDGRLIDWSGQEHSYTLVFKPVSGTVEKSLTA